MADRGLTRSLTALVAVFCALSVGARAQDEIAIGAIFPLSGASATQGEDQRRGAELAVERVNAEGGVLGKKLRVIVEDSGGRPQSALDVAKKLITVDKVPVVIGEYSSGITIPIAQYTLQEGRVHLNSGSSSGRLRSIGNGAFSVIGLDNVTTEFAANDVLEQGWKKAALIVPNNAYGQGVQEQFKKAYEKAGGKVVASILYTEAQTSYRRELQQLERAQPDVFVYTAYGKEAAIINRESFELGLNKKPWYGIYLQMCVADTPPEIAKGQIGMDVNQIGPNGKFYEDAYRKKYNEPFKSAFSGYAYDAVVMAAAAINKAKSAEPSKIRDALWEIGKSFEGATGPIVFDQDGQRSKQPYVRVRFDGSVVPR